MKKKVWKWTLRTAQGASEEGYIEGIDPRDAFSRLMTEQRSDGQLRGSYYRVPLTLLHASPGNEDTRFSAEEDGVAISLEQVTCPTEPRFEGDLVGCGSNHLTFPDEEGFVDCCGCGLFFES